MYRLRQAGMLAKEPAATVTVTAISTLERRELADDYNERSYGRKARPVWMDGWMDGCID